MPEKIIAIGGMGGSGTRVVSSLLMETDVYLGDCLNKALDNLLFSALFRQLPYEVKDDIFNYHFNIFQRVMKGEVLAPTEHAYIHELLENKMQFANIRKAYDFLMSPTAERLPAKPEKWGWKAPNTHIFLPRIWKIIPALKYIHVIRHGLDMAFSKNIKQPKIWGNDITGQPYVPTPVYQLHYWVCMHQRILNIREKNPDNFFLLSFDELCKNPAPVIKKLFEFVGEDLHQPITNYTSMVETPPSVGRFREHDLSQFPAADVAYVKSLGFSV